MQKICIVIPCYNEELRLPVEKFKKGINETDYYFIFVNDGSVDSTLDILNQIKKISQNRVLICDLKKNSGKAEAVRKGIMEAHNIGCFDIIGFLDADLATPISEISTITSELKNEIVFTFGSRIKRIGATIERKLYRHIFGRVFATFASNLLKLEVYDTQCGAKFFHRDIIEGIFSKPFQSKWIFDLEIFLRIKRIYKVDKIDKFCLEVPLREWKDIGGSKLKLKHLIIIPWNLFKLRNYKF
jgi:dolichyl-phosphate beta-glucosyltransferase